jgi:hypothetical protein
MSEKRIVVSDPDLASVPLGAFELWWASKAAGDNSELLFGPTGTAMLKEFCRGVWLDGALAGARGLLPAGPERVCLCGSTRRVLAPLWAAANRAETLAGRIVLSVGMLGHQEGLDMAGPVKAMLDELHLRKIELAHKVLVIDGPVLCCKGCGGPAENGNAMMAGLCRDCGPHSSLELRPYIGESTRREIAHAAKLGRPVRYWSKEQGAAK